MLCRYDKKKDFHVLNDISFVCINLSWWNVNSMKDFSHITEEQKNVCKWWMKKQASTTCFVWVKEASHYWLFELEHLTRSQSGKLKKKTFHFQGKNRKIRWANISFFPLLFSCSYRAATLYCTAAELHCVLYLQEVLCTREWVWQKKNLPHHYSDVHLASSRLKNIFPPDVTQLCSAPVQRKHARTRTRTRSTTSSKNSRQTKETNPPKIC